MYTPIDRVSLTADAPTVFATRDSDTEGKLSNSIDLWIARPRRFALDVTAGHAWINPDDIELDQCYLGPYSIAAVHLWCGTVPETDAECIRVEGRVRTDELPIAAN